MISGTFSPGLVFCLCNSQPRPQQSPWGSTWRSGTPVGSKPFLQKLCQPVQPEWILGLVFWKFPFWRSRQTGGSPDRVLSHEIIDFFFRESPKIRGFWKICAFLPCGCLWAFGELLFFLVLWGRSVSRLGQGQALSCVTCGVWLGRFWAVFELCPSCSIIQPHPGDEFSAVQGRRAATPRTRLNGHLTRPSVTGLPWNYPAY